MKPELVSASVWERVPWVADRLLADAPLHELSTPVLVADLSLIDENLSTAARFAEPIKLRPHFKAHKCSTLLRRQMEAHRCRSVTCATVREAEVAIQAGATDVLLANEVVDPASLVALAEMAQIAAITACVDNEVHISLLEEAARRADGVSLGVLIDIDVGQRRCGVQPGSSVVLELAERISSAEFLHFEGLMGYDGHAQSGPYDRRKHLTRTTAQILVAERARLERRGFNCVVISGGGTGTLKLAAEEGVLTEVQAGSYALLDGVYADCQLGFTPALFCLASIISRRANTAVADAGLKALAIDEGLPVCLKNGVLIRALNDEHACISLAPDCDLSVGDRIMVFPRHLDPTVNLHDAIYVWTGKTLERWPVDARRQTDVR